MRQSAWALGLWMAGAAAWAQAPDATEPPASAPQTAPGASTPDAVPADPQEQTQPEAVAEQPPVAPDALAPGSAPGTPMGTPPATSALTPEELERLRDEIKSDLREEMRAELEKASREVAQQKRAAQEWEEESWVEEIRPKLNFVEFDGYFRARADLFQRAHLGTYDPATGKGTSNFPAPLNYDVPDDRHDTITTANMRLRLDPTLNVSEDIRVRMTADVFDNLVLGSTPDTLPGLAVNPGNPLSAFTSSQLTPERGFNTYLGDSIRVKRVWGEVMTPFGQVRFGRMASHFGLGILANDGNCLECDHGNNADRAMFITRILGHYVIPMWEFTASGPVGRGGGPGPNAPLLFHPNELGQAYDLDPRDDVKSWILAVAKRDSPQDIREKLNRGGWVFNYGGYGQYRLQSFDSPLYYINEPPGRGISSTYDYKPRNAWAAIGSAWALFQWRKLKIEAEVAGIYGFIGNMQTTGSVQNDLIRNYRLVNGAKDFNDENGNSLGVPKCFVIPSPNAFVERGHAAPGQAGFQPQDIRILPDPSQGYISMGEGACIRQIGFALESSYSFLNDSLVIGLGGGYASGDSAPGFGFRNGANNFQSTNPGDMDGRQFGAQYKDGTTDNSIENFRFNPDYRVDMLMFREVIGTVTDAVYAKPSITYYVLDGLGVRGDAIAAIAQYANTTPGNSNLLGAEVNGHLFYKSEDGFYGGLTYAFMLPLAGFNHRKDPASGLCTNVGGDGLNQSRYCDAKFAQRFHGILGIQF